jgi:transposase-like protein
MLAACLALIERFGQPCHCCPYCAACRIYRHGMSSGLQRYRCLACNRTFNALTNTPLAFLRLRGKWLPYLQCVLDSLPVRAAAEKAGIHRNTSFRWRHRFLAQARHDRPPLLHGIVEADETYLLESQKGSRHLTRPARHRGGKAKRRGISGELDCILGGA